RLRAFYFSNHSTAECLFAEPGGVFGRNVEFVALAGVAEAQLDHQTIGVRRRVDERRLLIQTVVHFDDLAAERRIELRDGLYGFDGAKDVMLAEIRADLRELDEDDVAELALGVVRNAD